MLNNRNISGCYVHSDSKRRSMISPIRLNIKFSLAALLLLCVAFTCSVAAQNQPRSYIIAGIDVEGNSFADVQTIIAISGLRVGDEIKIPGPKQQEALKALWQRNQFSDVDITIDKITALGIFLTIKVKEYPRFAWLDAQGNDKVSLDDLKKAIGKARGDILSPYDVYLARVAVKKLYDKEGMMFARIQTETIPTDTPSYSRLLMRIEEGAEFYVSQVKFSGNVKIPSDNLADALEDTHSKPWWKFWRSSKFDKNKYDDDKKKLIAYYHNKGFIDADIIRDSLVYDEEKRTVSVGIDLYEGKQYYIRSISFTGNTVYPEELLKRRLNIPEKSEYNVERFEKNMTGNEDQTDVASLYLDNGYLNAQLVKEEKKIGEDSIDIVVRVYEKDRFTIRRVDVVGNTKTKDNVIRRELYTRPGDYFSRSAIIRSIRGLGVLNYFNPEALRPDVKPVDNTRVDLVYKVEERSTDTFNASVGIAGTLGLTGSVGVTLNNFSLSEPLRGGGGQILNLNLEFGQASNYQNYSLSFTEPWLYGSPTTLGFNMYYSNIRMYDIARTGASVNIGRRLRWPDDYFRVDGSLRAQRNVQGAAGGIYLPGTTTEYTVSSSITRISLDNLIFPTSGSRFSLGTQFAMGALGIGSTDYWKNSLNFETISPLVAVEGNPRLVLYLSSEAAYLTGVRQDTTVPSIERYYMGGNGLGGFAVTPLRGYTDRSIGPSSNGSPIGGRVLLRNVVELRFALSVNPMPIYILGFAEAGNVWANLSTADPFNLKRSAGLGMRILLNPIGLLGFDYGYGFDSSGAVGSPSGWQFHFQFGR